jgi:hypothetical protein
MERSVNLKLSVVNMIKGVKYWYLFFLIIPCYISSDKKGIENVAGETGQGIT